MISTVIVIMAKLSVSRSPWLVAIVIVLPMPNCTCVKGCVEFPVVKYSATIREFQAAPTAVIEPVTKAVIADGI